MDEYRQALQRLVNAIQFCERPALIQEARVLEPAIDAAKALLARGEPVQRTYLHLEGYQLANAYECLGGDFETDVTIAHYDERTDDETGEKMPAGLYLSYTDYPEEGCIFLSPDEPPKPVEPAAADHPAIDLVRKQACDAGLWFSPVTAAEGYLQQELRRLHAAIESQPAAAEKARERYQEGDVLLFIGWLSGDIAELRKVEVPRLADSWRRFKEALTSPPASKVEAEKAREWRPIETAPRGGKWILLWWPAVTDAPFVGYRVDDAWCAATNGCRWPLIDGPTHWMPLPSPPAATGDKP